MDLIYFIGNILSNYLSSEKQECPICGDVKILTNYPCNINHVVCYSCRFKNNTCYYRCNQSNYIDNYEFQDDDLIILIVIVGIKINNI